MKKCLSVLLVLCLFLSSVFALTSCSHECEFSKDWTSDEDFHWHACNVSGCEEVLDKAQHTWNDGEITTKATQDSEGVKTFTCDTCSATKTEGVEFTGLSKQEWNLALSDSAFENFSYAEVATTTVSGVSVDSETVYKFTKNSAWIFMSAAGQSAESYAPDTATANTLRRQLIISINDVANHDYFEYDAETKTYKAIGGILIAATNAYSQDVTLKFEGDRLVEITYSVSFLQSGVSCKSTSVITISDYGTTVLPPPTQS